MNIRSNNFLFINILLFLLLIPGVIWSKKANLSGLDSIILEVNSIITYISNQVGLPRYLIQKGLSFLLITSPIWIIVGYELFETRRRRRNDQNVSSIARIKFSDGYKNADIWYYVFSTLKGQFAFITVLLTIGLSRYNPKFLLAVNEFLLSTTHDYIKDLSRFNTIIVFAIILLCLDFTAFFAHWLEHKVPMIWDWHEFHHSATEMTIFNIFRVLPLEEVFHGLLLQPLNFTANTLLLDTYLLNGDIIPLSMYIVFEGYILFVGYFGHSNTKIIYPRTVNWILMSPGIHWIHHSTKPEHFDSNLGVVFSIWDRLFGTYLDDSHIADIPSYGVTGTDYNKYHPLYAFTVLPIIKFKRRVKKILTVSSLAK